MFWRIPFLLASAFGLCKSVCTACNLYAPPRAVLSPQSKLKSLPTAATTTTTTARKSTYSWFGSEAGEAACRERDEVWFRLFPVLALGVYAKCRGHFELCIKFHVP